MDSKTFNILFSEALEDADRDVFVSDWALSSVFAEESDLGENAEICGKIWDAAHLSVKEMREKMNMTQAQFAERFCMPKRTIENWEGGSRQAPDYVRLMMARELGLAQGFPEALPVIAAPHMSGWEELGEDAQFIYHELSYAFPGFKIDDKHAALINARGKFIIAKAFKNCLSIGSGMVLEYSTYEEIKERIKG